MAVRTERKDGIAIVTIDNPPANATSHAVRQGLADAVSATSLDETVLAVVLRCEGRSFVTGADIREFGQPAKEPGLADVLGLIESAPKPWVAAIHGMALGGGLELAMACHGRVAAEDAKLGLPEVTLGLIPGAGGTVRLPRLVPVAQAIEMAAGGRPVSAGVAHAVGLVDAISDYAVLLDESTALARRLAQEGTVPTIKRPVRPSDAAEVEEASALILKKARGQSAPAEAIAAIERAVEQPAKEALTAERAAFLRLKDDPQSHALRHMFFAERASVKHPRIKDVAPHKLEHIGIIGGGTMGAGIAAACLLSGLGVTMIERDRAATDAGRERVEATLRQSLERGMIDAARFARLTNRLDASASYEPLGGADLVIEAVFEDMALKQDVFRKLERHAAEHAILASNTSYLDVNRIAGVLANPSRALGLHFFSPAHIMKLVEIVVPDRADDHALASAASLAKKLGKIAVFTGVCDGFIGNRIMSRYRREAEAMLADGAMPWDIDAAMTDFGFPMGLFAMQDLAGLDIAKARRDAGGETGHVADPLVEAGRLGRKSGRGWYLYKDGRAVPDPEVQEMLDAWRGSRPNRGLGREQIMTRILGAMQDEGRKIVAEGIARGPDDVDVVMVHGYGFPRHLGGPMFMAKAGG